MYYEISSRPSFGENENYYFVVPASSSLSLLVS